MNIKINNENIIKIKRITDNIIESFGTISLKLFFGNIELTHIFHVVPNEFCIPSDGIIGKDFNRRFKCLISDMTFTIRLKTESIKIKIFTEPKTNVSALPARCGSYRIFHIEKFSTPCLIPSQQLLPGILIPNTIAHTKDVVVRVLNTNMTMQNINTQIKNAIPLNQFNVFVNAKSRIAKLKDYIKNTPEYARDELIELCAKYAHVFALPNDQLTVNNFYQQKLKMKSENSVYIKNYRLPKTQKDEIDNQVRKLLDNDLIEPSISAFNSPLILVPKKSATNEKEWRMCVDYACSIKI